MRDSKIPVRSAMAFAAIGITSILVVFNAGSDPLHIAPVVKQESSVTAIRASSIPSAKAVSVPGESVPAKTSSTLVTVDLQGDPISKQLRRAFSRVRSEQVPTGILLERGAIHYDTVIAQANGGADVPVLDQRHFNNALAELARGANDKVSVTTPNALRNTAADWIQNRNTTPVSIAVVAYDTLGTDTAETLQFDSDGKAILPDSAVAGESSVFVAATPQRSSIHRWVNRFVIPEKLVVTSGMDAGRITKIEVGVDDGPKQTVELDSVFSIPELDGPSATASANLNLNVAITVDDIQTLTALSSTPVIEAPEVTTRRTPRAPASAAAVRADPVSAAAAELSARAPVVNAAIDSGLVTSPAEECVPGIECYDLPQVTARIPFAGAPGVLNVRVYPAKGSVTRRDDGTLDVRLKRPLVAVDGFDLANTLTQEDFWKRFSFGILKFRELGYDVITIDYVNGRDWLQRNGYALRELFVHTLPQWNVTGEPVAVVAGSMGTQTSRWALTTSERADETHNVDLFIALDGPWLGANVPIGIQAAVEFVAPDLDEAQVLLDGLQSPAAREQLRRTFFNRNGTKVWYQPHPDADFYNTSARILGLPEKSRNVAFANGSGTGSRLIDTERSKLVTVDDGNFWGAIEIKTRTDWNGRVFKGRIRKFIFNRRSTLDLSNARFLDTAPGGLRLTSRQIKEVAEAADFAGVTVVLEAHGFVPTFSALGITTDNVNYAPANDIDVDEKHDFDAITWEKCNSEHVEVTAAMLAMLTEELTAFRDGEAPQILPRYENSCDVPEVADLCIAPVSWVAETTPRDIFPWNDGANCFVTPVPGNRTGFTDSGRYYIDAEDDGSCFAGTAQAVGERAACLVGIAPPGMKPFTYRGGFYYDGFD